MVRRLLYDYVKSPSLRHIRDPHMVNKLADEIARTLDRGNSPWLKWTKPREALVDAASGCWIPTDDLRRHLNRMDGPRLTLTDVSQRMRDMWEQMHCSYPNDALKEGCLAIYREEVELGTELPAIVGQLQAHVEDENQRLHDQQHAQSRERVRLEREALELRFRSGADCKWTPLAGSKELYSRINGRVYRLTGTSDKRWDLHRVHDEDDREGALIGRYRSRGDVSKILPELAYKSEPRW